MERYGDSMKVDVVRRLPLWRHGDSMKVNVVGRLPLWRDMEIA